MDWKTTTVESTGSTNADLVRAAREGAPEGTVLRAEAQSAGRGRQGRAWVSGKGDGLYFSVLLRPSVEPVVAATLPLAVGLAVAEAVEPLVGERVEVKWPNDLLVGGRKICGILCEMEAGDGGVRHVVAGIGLNVNLDVARLPADVAPVATSMRAVAGRAFEARAVLDAVLASLDGVYSAWLSGGLGVLLPRLRKRDALLGRKVSMGLCGTPVEGVAAGIASSGALLLRKSDGTVEEVFSGEAHIGGCAG